MLGPLAGGSPGNREVGRLRTREYREFGGLKGPGSGRTSGLPPRILFLPPSPRTMGSESAQALKSYYVPTLLVLWGRNWVAGPPFSAVFQVQRRPPPQNRLCSGDSPPGTFGVFSERRTRRVSRPLFRGDEEVGKLGDPAKGIWGERLQTTPEEDFIKKRKEER